MLSFCIPAHNEERLLPATLASIHAAARALVLDYEIIVAEDACTDGTGRAALASGARVIPIDRRQISAARNAAASGARGDVLLFVDADTRVHCTALSQALQLLNSGCVAGGALPRFDGRISMSASILVEALIVPYRLAGFPAGAFLFCTRGAFERAGRFDETVFVAEEVYFALSVKRFGRFGLIKERVVTSGRKLRAHSVTEILAVLCRLALAGRHGMSSREGLELWYGPRRQDPDDEGAK